MKTLRFQDEWLRHGWLTPSGMIRMNSFGIGMTKGMDDCLKAGMIAFGKDEFLRN